MITVYLDSSDYSTLSDTKRLNPDLSEVLRKLQEFKKSEKVKFIMSDTLVGEALPKSKDDIESSLRRVKLIREMCGDNVAISNSSLIKKELSQLAGLDVPEKVITNGIAWIPFHKSLFEKISSLNINVSTSGKIGPLKLKKIEKLEREIALGMIPIHPKHKETLVNAHKGTASKQDIANAFIETVNDLEWLVNSYKTSEKNVSSLRDYIRNAGIRMRKSSTDFAENLKKSNPYDTIKEWRRRADYFSLEIAAFSISKSDIRPSRLISIDHMATACPGYTARNKALFEYLWTYVGGSASKPILDSMYPDIMHITYAPYVDIFRPDRSMAPHVRKSLEGTDTLVVESLKNLPSAIEELISQKSISAGLLSRRRTP